ncbi:MAG: hypothetical protein ABJD97_03750 [Betaproteobacteria bacterium]
MTDDAPVDAFSASSAHPDLLATARHGLHLHPMPNPSDAEKYRWIRANHGNFAIVEALSGCDKDADFDNRIAAEMGMCAAGRESYRIGSK